MSSKILVLDNAIADRETLQQGLPDDMEVILLGGGDGLDELAEALSGRTDIEALHIVSHGSAGQLYLGGETLDAQALAEQSASLARIGQALSENGDILLYGCNTGAGAAGQTFVEQLALATGADVAASNDATGAAAMGGDWDLEVRSGVLDNAAPLSREAVERYGHLLGTFDFQNANSSDGGTGFANALVTQTVDGVQMDITATPTGANAVQLKVTTAAGAGFTGNYMYSDYMYPTSVQFRFDSAINISSLKIDTAGYSAENLIFSPTGGSNSPVYYTTTADHSAAGTATLDWTGVTEFTITKNGGGEMEAILVDDIVFTTGPIISIDDVSIDEGDSGTKTMNFTVTRTDSSGTLTVDYVTTGATATADSDYQTTSGALSFAAGQASKTISVTVNGDTLVEGNETFFVNLTDAVGGTISD
ncbi:MAG: DUF4347 domain-containing protein, partial [Opitutae bacterium]|nr:DUF4347 domain-containing protein [Opitutae bacterium]